MRDGEGGEKAVTGWIILGVLLLILAAVMLTPARVRVTYDQDGLTAWIRYGPFKIQLYPRPAGKTKKRKSPPKKEKPKKEEKKTKPRAKINREQIFYSLEKLPPVLGKALKRVGRRVTVSPLQVYLLIAGVDPADTAELYGRLSAALASGLPVLQRTVRIREQDIRLYPDFTEEKMQCIADVGIGIRPWDVLVIGVCAGASLVRWLLGFRKLASPPPEDAEAGDGAENKDGTTGEAA